MSGAGKGQRGRAQEVAEGYWGRGEENGHHREGRNETNGEWEGKTWESSLFSCAGGRGLKDVMYSGRANNMVLPSWRLPGAAGGSWLRSCRCIGNGAVPATLQLRWQWRCARYASAALCMLRCAACYAAAALAMAPSTAGCALLAHHLNSRFAASMAAREV